MGSDAAYDEMTERERVAGMTREAMMAPRPVVDLEWLFAYHAPDEDRRDRHEALRHAALTFAETLNELCPDGADKSTAIRAIRAALMWGNAAIACER